MKIKKRIIILLATLTIGVGGFWYGYQEYNAKPMGANNLIRLHVIANSDSAYDQKVKLLVRDEVIKYMAPYLQKTTTIEEARQAARENLPGIKKSAENCLAALGENYQTRVEMGDYNFPAKAYGDLVLPSGEYEAVRVVLGNGDGRNWWCVLYPPLCFIDISSTVAVTVRDMPETGEEVLQVNSQPAQVVVRFKLWEEVRGLFGDKFLARLN